MNLLTNFLRDRRFLIYVSCCLLCFLCFLEKETAACKNTVFHARVDRSLPGQVRCWLVTVDNSSLGRHLSNNSSAPCARALLINSYWSLVCTIAGLWDLHRFTVRKTSTRPSAFNLSISTLRVGRVLAEQESSLPIEKDKNSEFTFYISNRITSALKWNFLWVSRKHQLMTQFLRFLRSGDGTDILRATRRSRYLQGLEGSTFISQLF